MLALHAQGQVTTERLTALLNGIGVEIPAPGGAPAGRVARRPRGRGPGSAARRPGHGTLGDTAARHARRDGFTTQIGDERFAVFRTGASKSREAFLPVLRAGHTAYVVNAAALGHMRGHGLSGQVAALLDARPARLFADAAAWAAHVARLGIDALAVTPDPVQAAAEAALWGTIRHHGLLPGTVVVSDGAGQFRVGLHALCWAHAERLAHKLVPATPEQRHARAAPRRRGDAHAGLVAVCRPEGLGRAILAHGGPRRRGRASTASSGAKPATPPWTSCWPACAGPRPSCCG